jgi:hypothetical protein
LNQSTAKNNKQVPSETGFVSETNRRRSERVLLHVPVTVRMETQDQRPVHEETNTMVVNAHGGLLKLVANVVVGQRLVLVNPKTGVEQACRVVHVDRSQPEHAEVGFEFVHPSPQFWPVVFPPADWGLVQP